MNHPCIMIKCIVIDEQNIENKLLIEFTKITKLHWPQAYITLEHWEDYWKIKGRKKIVYGLVHSPIINVFAYIKIFPLTWSCTEGIFHDMYSHKEYLEENAMWSQLDNPNEIFLLPNVKWAHMYTWQE